MISVWIERYSVYVVSWQEEFNFSKKKLIKFTLAELGKH